MLHNAVAKYTGSLICVCLHHRKECVKLKGVNRIGEVKQKLKKKRLDSFLVSNSSNICYLTGFRSLSIDRESYFVFSPKRNILVVPRMYQAEVGSLTKSGFEVVYPAERNTLLHTAVSFLKGKVGFETRDLRYGEYEFINKKLDSITPTKNLIEDLRILKDKDELRRIKKAVKLTDRVFNEILNHLRVGQTEFEIAQKIHSLAIKYGGEDISFPTIVAFGKGSSMPHYHTAAAKISKGQMLLLDFGVRYQGYCGDLTRMVYFGKPDEKFTKIYRVVQKAQQAAIEAVADGAAAKKTHKAALGVLRKAGLEKNFLHGVGHGVGMDIHEAPFLSEDSDTILKERMVITIEPGVYIEGWGGVRIEDVVLVTKNGHEVLSKASRDIIRI